MSIRQRRSPVPGRIPLSMRAVRLVIDPSDPTRAVPQTTLITGLRQFGTLHGPEICRLIQ